MQFILTEDRLSLKQQKSWNYQNGINQLSKDKHNYLQKDKNIYPRDAFKKRKNNRKIPCNTGIFLLVQKQ